MLAFACIVIFAAPIPQRGPADHKPVQGLLKRVRMEALLKSNPNATPDVEAVFIKALSSHRKSMEMYCAREVLHIDGHAEVER
jgi:hypothetical protein